jgi:hypothetical protein
MCESALNVVICVFCCTVQPYWALLLFGVHVVRLQHDKMVVAAVVVVMVVLRVLLLLLLVLVVVVVVVVVMV